MLACGDDGFKVLRVKKRRRGYDDGVDFLGGGDFVGSIRPNKELRGIDSAEAFGLLEPVEVGPSGVELILKHVGERHDTRSAGLHQIASVFGAAPAAAEQADADGGVGVRAANKRGLDKHQTGGGSRAADKPAAVESVGGVVSLIGVV